MASDILDMTQVMEQIQKHEIKNVRFELMDLNTVARSKTIPARHFKQTATSGIFFPIIIFSWDPTADIAMESNIAKRHLYSDMVCHPDLSTFSILPWVKNTARVIINGSSVGECDKVSIDPRNILKAQLENLKKRDLSMFSSFEYEFWMVDEKTKEPIIDGVNCYSTLRLARHQELSDEIADNLYQAGVDIECIETEYGKGQFETTMEPSWGIRAADNAATFRTGVKEMAMQHGVMASFMSKPYKDVEGTAGHLNHSLWSLDRKTSKMSDPSRPFGLSELGEHWIAGLLEHAPSLSFLQSPTICCRDRFQPGCFAPFNATWGDDNRTCAIRLKKKGPHGMYVENRIGSSAGNPYISLAATIAAGIDGIDRKLPLPPPVPMNKPSDDEASIPPGTVLLPTNMEDALNGLKDDDFMVNALGQDLVNSLECIRRLEMAKLSGDRFKWSRETYFEYI